MSAVVPLPFDQELSTLSDSELIHHCSSETGDPLVAILCDRLTRANMRLARIRTLTGEIKGVLQCAQS